jgi:hypothetical protein
LLILSCWTQENDPRKRTDRNETWHITQCKCLSMSAKFLCSSGCHHPSCKSGWSDLSSKHREEELERCQLLVGLLSFFLPQKTWWEVSSLTLPSPRWEGCSGLAEPTRPPAPLHLWEVGLLASQQLTEPRYQVWLGLSWVTVLTPSTHFWWPCS